MPIDQGSKILLAVSGWIFIFGGAWGVVHRGNRVDASFSRGTDWLSLPPSVRPVFGLFLVLMGALAVVATL